MTSGSSEPAGSWTDTCESTGRCGRAFGVLPENAHIYLIQYVLSEVVIL